MKKKRILFPLLLFAGVSNHHSLLPSSSSFCGSRSHCSVNEFPHVSFCFIQMFRFVWCAAREIHDRGQCASIKRKTKWAKTRGKSVDHLHSAKRSIRRAQNDTETNTIHFETDCFFLRRKTKHFVLTHSIDSSFNLIFSLLPTNFKLNFVLASDFDDFAHVLNRSNWPIFCSRTSRLTVN